MVNNGEQRMIALIKEQVGQGMQLTRYPVPEPDVDEVRIQVESVGIDGGAEALIYDWHEGKRHYEPDLPQLFGHEFAGVVDALGAEVTSVEIGTRVAVEPFIGCGTCMHCRSGFEAICPNRRLIGLNPEIDGAFAEYVTVPARTVYPVDEDITFDEAVFLELLGLGVHGLEVSDFKPGDSIAITGPGPVGIGTLIAAVAGGASSITMLGTDIDMESRLPLATELGATAVGTDPEIIDEPVDVFIEASGHESALEAATDHVRRGGDLVQTGLYHGVETVSIDLTRLVRKAVSIRPVYGRRDSSWRRAIEIGKRTDLSPAIGPVFDLADYEAAFEAVRNREGIKITLHP